MTRTLVVLCTFAAGLAGCATHHEPPQPEQLVDQLKEDAAQKKAQPASRCPGLSATTKKSPQRFAGRESFQPDDLGQQRSSL